MAITKKVLKPKPVSKKQTPGYSANNTSTLNQVGVKMKKGGTVKDKNWISGAVNPAHKGFCTPMSKPTCTPKRKALAKTLKKISKNK
jgi:hypothetical protein